MTTLTRRGFCGALAAGASGAGLFPQELFGQTAAVVPALGAGRPRPTPEQVTWQDMELGLFFHYDMPVFKPGWDHRQYESRPEPGIFNPKKLDTDQWMEAAKAMGAKYAVLTAKHGSGFMLWQSDLYPYGMKQSPYKNGKGDIVRDFVNSCRKHDIRPGLYAHMGCNGYLEADNPGLINRGAGGDPDKQARYARICEGMLEELWGNYGPLFEIWFDGGVMDHDKGGPNMLPILSKLQPKAIVFQEFGDEIRKRFGKSLAETNGQGRVVELALDKPVAIDRVIIMEQIAEGERIRKYAVEGLVGDEWKTLCNGQSIGHKRIECFAPTVVGRVRLRVTDAVAEPVIRKLAVYAAATPPA